MSTTMTPHEVIVVDGIHTCRVCGTVGTVPPRIPCFGRKCRCCGIGTARPGYSTCQECQDTNCDVSVACSRLDVHR